MSDANLIVSATWFSVLVAAFFGILYLIYRHRYGTHGRQYRLLDGMRMHRDKPPEYYDPSAPLMSGDQILDYIVPRISVPA